MRRCGTRYVLRIRGSGGRLRRPRASREANPPTLSDTQIIRGKREDSFERFVRDRPPQWPRRRGRGDVGRFSRLRRPRPRDIGPLADFNCARPFSMNGRTRRWR